MSVRLLQRIVVLFKVVPTVTSNSRQKFEQKLPVCYCPAGRRLSCSESELPVLRVRISLATPRATQTRGLLYQILVVSYSLKMFSCTECTQNRMSKDSLYSHYKGAHSLLRTGTVDATKTKAVMDAYIIGATKCKVRVIMQSIPPMSTVGGPIRSRCGSLGKGV